MTNYFFIKLGDFFITPEDDENDSGITKDLFQAWRFNNITDALKMRNCLRKEYDKEYVIYRIYEVQDRYTMFALDTDNKIRPIIDGEVEKEVQKLKEFYYKLLND